MTGWLDEAARRRFVTAHDQNFAVVAAAGAGKTRAVVDRIVSTALRDLAAVERLVVVTYTKTAAREFKRRATAAVLGASTPARVPAILSALDRAFFGTIHSFCLGLLSDHQVELGFPSRLQTIKDVEGRRLWEAFLSDPAADAAIREHPLTEPLLRFCPLSDLLHLAGEMEGVRDGEPVKSPPAFLDPQPLLEARAGRNPDVREALLREIDRYNRSLASDAPFVGLPNLDGATDGLKAACKAVVAPLTTWLEDAAYAWAAVPVAEYCRQRHRDGLLTYQDQIGLTVKLLGRPHVLDGVRRRGFAVILDEAQDTDARMFEVLIEIVRPPGSPWGTWPGSGAPPRPGAFVLVGDPRQTIYDGAGTETYRAILDSFHREHGGELLEFSVTHRCSVEVVNAINGLLAGLAEGAQAFDNLQASNDAGPGAAVWLPLEPFAGSVTGVDAECAAECETIARWLVSAGRNGLGIERWGQVAVIAPRHAWLETCRAAFAGCGLPHGLFRPRIPWGDQPGFTWPLAVLYTAMRPWDRFERLGVLREVFAIADPVLETWVKGGAVTDPALADALGLLNGLAGRLDRAEPPSIVDLLHQACAELRLGDRLRLLPGTHDEAFDALLSRAYAGTHEGAPLGSWLGRLLDELTEEAPVRHRQPDAIDLVTVHSAKGLEWDVVIPLGLGRDVTWQDSSPYPQLVNSRRWSGVVWSPLSARAALVKRPDDTEERRRLLYVGLTRARRALVLPYGPAAYGRSKKSLGAVASHTPEHLPIAAKLPAEGSFRQEEFSLDVLARDPSAVAQAARLSQDYPRLSRPHALAEDAERSERFLEEPDRAFDFGRWWHGWIERFPWQGGRDGQAAYCRNIPATLSFGARAAREAAALLASDAFALLRAEGARFHCEAPFSFFQGEGRWMEGVIDLLIHTRAGETWVLDWKTNQPAPGQAAEAFLGELRAKYLPQLAAYQGALEAGFGVTIHRLLIYSTVCARFA